MIKEVNGKEIAGAHCTCDEAKTVNKDNFEEIKEEIRKNRINWLKEKIE